MDAVKMDEIKVAVQRRIQKKMQRSREKWFAARLRPAPQGQDIDLEALAEEQYGREERPLQ